MRAGLDVRAFAPENDEIGGAKENGYARRQWRRPADFKQGRLLASTEKVRKRYSRKYRRKRAVRENEKRPPAAAEEAVHIEYERHKEKVERKRPEVKARVVRHRLDVRKARRHFQRKNLTNNPEKDPEEEGE